MSVFIIHTIPIHCWLMGVWILQLPIDDTPDNGPPTAGAQPAAIPAPVTGALPAGAPANFKAFLYCTCLSSAVLSCFNLASMVHMHDIHACPALLKVSLDQLQTSLKRFLGPPLVPCDLAHTRQLRHMQATAPFWLVLSWNVVLHCLCHVHGLSMKLDSGARCLSICMTAGC